jgi:hypothetical protein
VLERPRQAGADAAGARGSYTLYRFPKEPRPSVPRPTRLGSAKAETQIRT